MGQRLHRTADHCGPSIIELTDAIRGPAGLRSTSPPQRCERRDHAVASPRLRMGTRGGVRRTRRVRTRTERTQHRTRRGTSESKCSLARRRSAWVALALAGAAGHAQVEQARSKQQRLADLFVERMLGVRWLLGGRLVWFGPRQIGGSLGASRHRLRGRLHPPSIPVLAVAPPADRSVGRGPTRESGFVPEKSLRSQVELDRLRACVGDFWFRS
jgi:hypothetical protein